MRPEDFNRQRDLACFVFSLSFAGLVVLARSMNPIPSRTRPLNSSAPMVLWLKPWESRSLPGLQRTDLSSSHHKPKTPLRPKARAAFLFVSMAVRSDAIERTDRSDGRKARSQSEPVKPEHRPDLQRYDPNQQYTSEQDPENG